MVLYVQNSNQTIGSIYELWTAYTTTLFPGLLRDARYFSPWMGTRICQLLK